MNGSSFLRSLEGGAASHREVEWLDVLVYAEENHPGPGNAARWLADEMGVSRRTAERYLAITTPGTEQSHQPRRAEQVAAADRLREEIQEEWDDADAEQDRQQVADLLRLIRKIKPGRVIVRDVSSGRTKDSQRTIGKPLDVDLDAVAEAWEDGDDQEAADLLGQIIIEAYGNDGGVEELDENIMIVDYLDGIDWS